MPRSCERVPNSTHDDIGIVHEALDLERQCSVNDSDCPDEHVDLVSHQSILQPGDEIRYEFDPHSRMVVEEFGDETAQKMIAKKWGRTHADAAVIATREADDSFRRMFDAFRMARP